MQKVLDLIRRPASSRARVARGSIAYAVAAVTQRAVGLLMLPIYVRVVGSAEYGQLAVATTISAAAATILSFGLETAIFRSYIHLGTDPARRDRFVNTVGVFLLAVPTLAIIAIGLLILRPVSSFFAIGPEAIGLALASVAVTVPATILTMALLRAQERLTDYLRVSVVTVVAHTGFMILFVIVLRGGLNGWLLAVLLGAAVQLAIGLVVLGHRWTRSFDVALLRGALVFGLPLIPHAISHWALALSDRAILGAYVAPSQIGIYNLAYQLALPLGMLTVAMNQGIMPIYAEATHDEVRRQELGGLASRQVVVTCLLGMAIALLGPPTIRLVMPAEFGSAAGLLPWIAAGYTFFGLYLLPMDAVSVMAGQTRWVWISTFAAGSVNIALNLATIPTFGTAAAAVNTAVAYGVLLVLLLVYQYRVARAPIRLAWSRLGLALAVMGLGLLCAILLLPDEGSALFSFIGRSVVLIAVAAILWATFVRGLRRPSMPRGPT
ncbi:MAG: oligosaccharide flippase family protein [Chloroflexota bacterium]